MKFSRRLNFFSILALATGLCAFGPVAPTGEVTSKTKSSGGSGLDLPYKPRDINDTGTLSDNDLFWEDKPPEEIIDWEKMPFVPSKKLELKPAPDPEI